MLNPKYAIEGNINFHDELKKLLNDDDDENNENICQITGYPLSDKFVTLECKHKFNYDAIYKELVNQRYKYKNYNLNSISLSDRKKFIDSGANFFIRCPYCRNIQFTILPYYEELGLNKEYGLNSLDNGLRNPLIMPGFNINPNVYTVHKGLVFKNIGKFCDNVDTFGDLCVNSYVCNLPNTTLYYCYHHYRSGCKKYNMDQSILKKNLKLTLKKEKEDILNENKKQLEEINNERIKKGLNPLKRLPKKKDIQKEDNIQKEEILCCSAILKSGINKGNKCGSTKIEKDGLCKRHAAKE
jgi:hypothetical protein